MMILVVFVILSATSIANAFFNSLECCCGCRTNSCPPQAFGCPPPTNPCVNAFFTFGRYIAPCKSIEKHPWSGYNPQQNRQQTNNDCRYPPCVPVRQHLKPNVVYNNNALHFSNPQSVTTTFPSMFQHIDANVGDRASESAVLSAPTLNVPGYDKFAEQTGQQISIAPLPNKTLLIAENPYGDVAIQLTDSSRQNERTFALVLSKQNESHSTTNIVENPLTTDAPARSSVEYSGLSTLLQQSTAESEDGQRAQGVVLVPASSIIIEASDPEPTTRSPNEKEDPNMKSENSTTDNGYTGKISFKVSPRFNGASDGLTAQNQSVVNMPLLISTLQHDTSLSHNNSRVYETIASDFGTTLGEKLRATTNMAPIAKSLPGSTAGDAYHVTRTEKKVSVKVEDVMASKAPIVENGSGITEKGGHIKNDHKTRQDEINRGTSPQKRSFAQSGVKIRNRTDTSHSTSSETRTTAETTQQAINKIRQSDHELARIDNVLTGIQELLTMVRKEIELEEADTNEGVMQSWRETDAPDRVAKERWNWIGDRGNSSQKKSVSVDAPHIMQNIADTRQPSKSYSEETVDEIQEIISNLRHTQLRDLKRKKYLEKTQRNQNGLNASSQPSVRTKRSLVRRSSEESLQSKEPESVVQESVGEGDLYADHFMSSEKESFTTPTTTSSSAITTPTTNTLPFFSTGTVSKIIASGVSKPKPITFDITTAAPFTTTTTPQSKILVEPLIDWSFDEQSETAIPMSKEDKVEKVDLDEAMNEMGGDEPALSNNCNELELKRIIEQNIDVNDASVSKRRIQKVTESRFEGTFDVVCSRSEFSYLINSDTFCEGGKGEIACLVFRQEYP
ncbi:hypothetical protein Tcan_14025 [Toxocara canis]|uniref:Ground-like domain-containing protein n=1 Tax=Toxocara canis TaxID=6265 RepID=A0A0B2VLA0_TOXCA|nr:hypothetical protein Tcan_14025 [Toxocara canis]